MAHKQNWLVWMTAALGLSPSGESARPGRKQPDGSVSVFGGAVR